MAQESNRETLAGFSEAFAIMSRYSSETYDFCACHDEIFAGVSIDMSKVSPEDLARLDELGWTPCKDGGFRRGM